MTVRSEEGITDMRIAMRLSCCVVLIVGMMGVVAPASVSAHAVSPLSVLKNCAYYSESGHCVDWYPNQWTCYNDLESSS